MFNQIISQLQARQPLPPLCPTQVWDAELSRAIQNAPDLSDAVRAGLLLWNDDLDASHTISQGIHTATGSFWHAIMHRREGDYSNSLYWWRRTGAHPAFGDIQASVLAVLAEESDTEAQDYAATLKRTGTWQPDEFVTLCERAQRGNKDWLCRVQVAEIETLLRWCRDNSE